MATRPQTVATVSTCIASFYLRRVLLQHTDGLGVDGGGVSVQVGDGAVGLDGQNGVGLRHVHRVVDVRRATVLQLHLLKAALVICVCTERKKDGWI